MMNVILPDWMIAIIYIAMRHSEDEKAASHERIVGITAARIRENGTEQPGVAEIMRAAGLTHGGFYKHFGSREELIVEAVERALTDNEPRVPERHGRARIRWPRSPTAYVSTAHRDDPATGCGVVALGADVPASAGRPRRRTAPRSSATWRTWSGCWTATTTKRAVARR